MSEPGINDFANLALFLPFSCNQKPQSGANRRKAKALQVVEKRVKPGIYGGSASTCKSLQKRVSTGSGPGGRWFESTRPDQFVFNRLHIKPYRNSGRSSQSF